MDLLEALAQSKKSPGSACLVGVVLNELSPKDAATLREALGQPCTAIPHAQLVRALGMLGKKVTANSIGRHRTGECRCGSL